MTVIDTEIKEDKLDEVTVEEAEDNKAFVDELNYLIAEGFIEVEEGPDGEPRLFPASSN